MAKLGHMNRIGKMIRYYKQKDKLSCGPIALYNTKKWLGIKGSWDKERCELQTICKCCESNDGTRPKDLHKAMKMTLPKMIGGQHKNPKLFWIDKQLKLGRAVIIRFFHDLKKEGRREGHYILITEQTSKTYQVVGLKYTTQEVHRHEIATYLRLKKGSYTPIAWAVSR